MDSTSKIVQVAGKWPVKLLVSLVVVLVAIIAIAATARAVLWLLEPYIHINIDI